jgi:hypothetical protein
MSLLLEMFDLVHGVETVLVEEDWLMSMRQDLFVCLFTIPRDHPPRRRHRLLLHAEGFPNQLAHLTCPLLDTPSAIIPILVMSSIRRPSSLVIQCFKRVERAADWVTGAAGPVFVGLCWLLIVTGGMAFGGSSGSSYIAMCARYIYIY